MKRIACVAWCCMLPTAGDSDGSAPQLLLLPVTLDVESPTIQQLWAATLANVRTSASRFLRVRVVLAAGGWVTVVIASLTCVVHAVACAPPPTRRPRSFTFCARWAWFGRRDRCRLWTRRRHRCEPTTRCVTAHHITSTRCVTAHHITSTR